MTYWETDKRGPYSPEGVVRVHMQLAARSYYIREYEDGRYVVVAHLGSSGDKRAEVGTLRTLEDAKRFAETLQAMKEHIPAELGGSLEEKRNG